jgi:exosome complex RNA-binding protein Rrp42 (RNase PH superfamily)
VEVRGRKVAALRVDPALREHGHLVDAVCAAAAFALENERLAAELRARLEERFRADVERLEAIAGRRFGWLG